jgi:4,5-dihydroxyphthalate decarboxylase
MANPRITIAVSHYDRHVPFFDGTVQPDGIDLNVLIVGQSDRQRDGEDRHERMLQNGEFDVAEVSLSSYLMAKSRGMPFTGDPGVSAPVVQPLADVDQRRGGHQRTERFDRQKSRLA